MYEVPSKDKFSENTFIEKIRFSVPNSQLNFHTTIRNKINNKSITFRNEIRYSHGQLNGTPEAKFYIDSGELLTIYNKV